MVIPRTPDTAPLVAALLRDKKEELLRQWTCRVLDDPKVPQANRLSEPDLRDHIPKLINRMIEALLVPETHEGSGEAAGRVIGRNSEATAHAHQRIFEHYSINAAMRELSHFRAALLDLFWEEGMPLEGRAALLVHATIDESMSTAATEMEQAATIELRQDAMFRERFVGILGHDLRNPLSAISFGAALLLKKGGLPEETAKTLRRIDASARRMARMINDVLDLTRSRIGGGLPVDPRPADLHAICRQAIEELEAAHPSRTVLFRADGDGSGVWDPDRLAQAVSNLVGNALSYSPAGTPVRITALDQGESVLFEVGNDGQPILPDVMATLFDPFTRGEPASGAGRSKGLGLGLFIVKQIVEAHGGSIEVASAAGLGTTFTVRLPRSRARTSSA